MNAGKHYYHNKALQKRSEFFGLIIDQLGHTQYTPLPSPFMNALEKYDVTAPRISRPVTLVNKP